MSQGFDRLKEALTDRYAIEREIGSGGMATVYLAQDPRHQRQVAVKVLRPELAASLGTKRFLREIAIAASLSHPHILPLHDSGRAEGFLYYVMPYVDGESLRGRLTREGQLPLDDALQITRELADALAYAHSQGIVHRDVKPENILFEAGHAVVTDFGIARAISVAAGERLTETGLAVGTAAYMSPEQAGGAEALDARSDIYSLACVLYEMLAGAPPFAGHTPQAVLARHAADPVPPVRTVRATVAPAVEAAIMRAIAKAPADRFATALQFTEALASGAASPAVAARTTAPAMESSIAVLPFANLSADPAAEYFSDGLTEELINALAQVPTLHVAARTSSFAFKGKNVSIRTLSEELNVRMVLEGSVRHAGNKLRLTAQLINVADGYHLWSERYDREMTDVFAIQDEIAAAIVKTLKVQLAAQGEAGIVRRGTDDLEAYHAYLKGRHFWNQRDLPRAVSYFEEAIARDADYAQAYAGLAETLCFHAQYAFGPSKPSFERATAASRRAIELDDDLPEGHRARGVAEFGFGWNLDEAERELRRAIDLDARSAANHVMLGAVLAIAGRSEEVLLAVRRAQELEPLSALINAQAGVACVLARRFPEAMETCQRALELDPHWGPALWVLGLAYTGLGRDSEALVALERAASAMDQNVFVLMHLGAALASAGLRDEAVAVLRELHERSTRQYVPPLSFAWVYLRLGEADRGFERLRDALAERNFAAAFVSGWPGFEWVGADPRYMALLRGVGVHWAAAPVTRR